MSWLYLLSTGTAIKEVMIKIPFLIFSGCVYSCDGLLVSDIFYGVKYLRLLLGISRTHKGICSRLA